ncbi:hypothetical protein ES708_33147 [subsurface metagenome]
MAKPKSPLLSLGARGTIADSLTFQKRGRGTITRTKPIPQDPKSPAQLAQRQIYRDAVDAWHALSAEEKEAWRGVCPGLTAYQCFMQAKIRELLFPPPPEEYTEEQTLSFASVSLSSEDNQRAGQRLTIANRKVTKLAFRLFRRGSPTGDVTFTIRKVSDDSIILSKVLTDASEISDLQTWYEVTFATPTTINQEVRILCEFSGGTHPDRIEFRMYLADVKPDEFLTRMKNGTYTDVASYDGTYKYKYYLP